MRLNGQDLRGCKMTVKELEVSKSWIGLAPLLLRAPDLKDDLRSNKKDIEKTGKEQIATFWLK
jgi:hypothetical protein